jgi:hypothetical protein
MLTGLDQYGGGCLSHDEERLWPSVKWPAELIDIPPLVIHTDLPELVEVMVFIEQHSRVGAQQ